LGSVGKKDISGDIDLAVDVKDIMDKTMSDKAIQAWSIDPAKVDASVIVLKSRARTATDVSLRIKAFLKELVSHINKTSKLLKCDEKKITPGNIFGRFPQYSSDGPNGKFVQLDWMVGDLPWLTFSYFSAEYPKTSNVKGLHRTQLMLAAFQALDMSFIHITGVKDKITGEVVANNPDEAIASLNKGFGLKLTKTAVEDFYKLNDQLAKTQKYQLILDIYFKILDSTRCDIPDVLQANWIKNKSRLHLTGKFLPDNSALKSLQESGSTGADRIASRNDFNQFIKSYEAILKKFPGFVSIKPSGSYNSDASKTSFGDIDLITHIQGTDKAKVKKDLAKFLEALPASIVVPFSSPRYTGVRSLNTGEIITIRYFDPKVGYSVQVDNIIAIDADEANFKQKFLDFPAEKQGLILGLIKTVLIETPVAKVFKTLGIKAPTSLPKDEEYEFNLSSVSLQLRHVIYEAGSFKQKARSVVWQSTDFDLVEKLLHEYDLTGSFDKLLKTAKSNLKNDRSPQRMAGVFKTMISVKSGEVGTEKGAGKLRSIAAVSKAFV
jgi:hypothetical protein